MTARQYLSQLKKITASLWIMHEEIERQRSRLESTTIPLRLDRVQSSGGGDSMADGIAALADKELLYADRIYEYERLRSEIVERILKMESPLFSDILYMVYVEQKPRAEIASRIYYSENYTSVLHAKALQAFEAENPELVNL